MIAPEVRRGGNGETCRRRLLRHNLGASALVFLLLQLWRPRFFSTDDNLDGGLPFFTEVGRHLLAGHSPFFSNYLFGGHYNLLRDPIFFAWHPLYLVVSLLAGTPFHWLIIDVDAFCLLMLATAGFVNLAWYLRRDFELTVTDGWIMFYTLSFTYSMIALATGASWLTFLGNISALPWLALGILQRKGWGGAALVALFSLHQILGGHLEPTISSGFFLSIFALAMSVARGSIVPLRAWVTGNLAAVIILLPLLLPALAGFLNSARSHGVDLTDMGNNNIPVETFPVSVFLGMAFWLIHPPNVDMSATYVTAMGSCAAAWCVVPALARPGWTRLQQIVAGMLGLLALFIIRPHWINVVMSHLPLLKSMRWPFREFVQFQFFLHVFLLVRRPGFPPRVRVFFAILSTALFVPPLLSHEPPTFADMKEDRRLLFSGVFDSYWGQVRALLRPGDRVAVIIPPQLYENRQLEKPYCLLGTYNYAELGHFVNVWGWSQTPPRDQYAVRTLPLYVFGAYTPEQRGALEKEDARIRFITLEGLAPLKITLSSRDGPTVDLTPFVPVGYRGMVGPERKALGTGEEFQT